MKKTGAGRGVLAASSALAFLRCAGYKDGGDGATGGPTPLAPEAEESGVRELMDSFVSSYMSAVKGTPDASYFADTFDVDGFSRDTYVASLWEAEDAASLSDGVELLSYDGGRTDSQSPAGADIEARSDAASPPIITCSRDGEVDEEGVPVASYRSLWQFPVRDDATGAPRMAAPGPLWRYDEKAADPATHEYVIQGLSVNGVEVYDGLPGPPFSVAELAGLVAGAAVAIEASFISIGASSRSSPRVRFGPCFPRPGALAYPVHSGRKQRIRP